MKRKLGTALLLTLLPALAFISPILAEESRSAVVQAVLFYRPTCPHCHEVIEVYLPPIKEQYGEQFQLIGVDTSLETGAKLYEEMVVALNLPADRLGVPLLVVGDIALVGSQDIPRELPAIIEKGLAGGGIGWPDLPGLREAFPDLPESAVASSISNPKEADLRVVDEDTSLTSSSLSITPSLELPDLIIGWAVIAFTGIVLIYTAVLVVRAARMGRLQTQNTQGLRGWSIPVLGMAGLVIAAYLAYVELTQIEAVCGPVGECNVVQSSQYARLVGIPIAVYGILFYLTILVLWILLRFRKEGQMADWIVAAMTALSYIAALFSVYLTVLELLVIRAVCAWCLTSAVISTLLLLFTTTHWLKKDRSGTEGSEFASQTS